MVRFRRIETRDRIFFLTTNLNRRVRPLSPSERDLLLEVLEAQRALHGFLLFGYVVMPTHAHLLLASRQESITRILRDWKSRTGFEIMRRRATPGPLWQERYFDHIIRRVRDFWQKLEYIHENPVAARLVKRPSDWRRSSARSYGGDG